MNRNGVLLRNWRLLSSLLVLALAGSAAASLCVWRQPDGDIAGIFGTGTYKTVFVDIADSMAQKIEKRLGYALDPDETQFKFFPVFRKGKQIGTVMTHAGKGQYGAIEVVVAVVPESTRVASSPDEVRSQKPQDADTTPSPSPSPFKGEGMKGRGMGTRLVERMVVKEVRIQRDREKAKAALRSEEFLGQFKGMSANDEFRMTDGESDLKPAAKGAEKASQAVASAVRKLLVVYEELNTESRQGRQERQGVGAGQ